MAKKNQMAAEEDLKTDEGVYRVWFRHSNMAVPRNEWTHNSALRYRLPEIIRKVGEHTLTHMLLYDCILPNIDTLFPQLTDLSLKKVRVDKIASVEYRSISQLGYLENLENLRIAYSEFPKGLPDHMLTPTMTLKELCVRNSTLPTFPKGISQLKNLEVLDITKNTFSDNLPDDMFTSSMTSLKELYIRYCNLTALPDSLTQLENLETLNISGNNFSNGLPEDIFRPFRSALVKLHIQSCQLTSLPQSITQLKNLKTLNISGNDFSKGLPDDIFESMIWLKKLDIMSCKFETLPQSLQSLQQLTDLNMLYSSFTSLPSVVCTLTSLKSLDISGKDLCSLNPKILQLRNLRNLAADTNLPKLISPPIQIFKSGVDAINQYYKDLAKGTGRNFPMVTIAVIGKASAGKTSIVKTLQSTQRKRVLTNRDPDANVDKTTKVFRVEEVEVDDTMLRLIDMGGQEVYHITYQLTLKQNCIPVVVVSMEQYYNISKESNKREAVRRCAFDYLSHLYLANPDLDSPKLVFTHQDLFEDSEFHELKDGFIQTSNDLCHEIVEEDKLLGGQVCKIKLFANSSKGIFLPQDIYEVGKDSKYAVFEKFKKNLLRSCQNFKKQLPEIWEDVNDRVLSLPSIYSTFEEVFTALYRKDHRISRKQISIILQYMHDCGKILWYKSIASLESYYFHKITMVTKLLCVFYHHDPDQKWKERREEFKPYIGFSTAWVDREHYNAFVSHFLQTGVMDEDLLFYLIKEETSFTSKQDLEVAISLMTTFRLIHGPIKSDSNKMSYIIPYFATGHSHTSAASDEALTFQVDLLFKGLSLPQYVYHQMIVRFFELFPTKIASKVVNGNGAVVYDDGFEMQLIHDYKSMKASIYVSSAAQNVCEMWNKLKDITNATLRQVKEAWPASRTVTVFYCAHCLLIQNPHPQKVLDPDWSFSSRHSRSHQSYLAKTSSTLICSKEETFAVFQHPCTYDSLPDEEVSSFKEMVDLLKARGKLAVSEKNQLASNTSLKEEDLSEVSDDEDDDEDDDDDENIFPTDGAHHLVLLNRKPKPVTNPKIECLFSNANKVFQMKRKRGRALIINNKNFENRPDISRDGSDADVQNMADMLKEFKFEVIVKKDLKAEVILSTVQAEVEQKAHEDMGCHVLVIMSHGTADNRIFGADMKLVNLTHVFDLLTSINFPGMSGKPKVVIVEACSGDRIDVGERGIHPFTKGMENGQEPKYETVAPLPSEIGQRQEAESMDSLNYDNLLVIKASVESFISKRHPVFGGLMIRALVSTMYNHACHKDVYQIFKLVQRKVRSICIKRKLDDGQIPVVWDTLTHGRKLYLFPGFNGPRRDDS